MRYALCAMRLDLPLSTRFAKFPLLFLVTDQEEEPTTAAAAAVVDPLGTTIWIRGADDDGGTVGTTADDDDDDDPDVESIVLRFVEIILFESMENTVLLLGLLVASDSKGLGTFEEGVVRFVSNIVSNSWVSSVGVILLL